MKNPLFIVFALFGHMTRVSLYIPNKAKTIRSGFFIEVPTFDGSV
jgi:hypothetical protein